MDNVITKEEQKLLDRAAKKLNISNEEYQKILKNPEKYPVNPPVEYDERITRLYTLTKMIFADEKIDKKEVSILNKIAVALNFPLQNIEKICDEAIHLVLNDDDLTIFNSAIKKVNQNL